MHGIVNTERGRTGNEGRADEKRGKEERSKGKENRESKKM